LEAKMDIGRPGFDSIWAFARRQLPVPRKDSDKTASLAERKAGFLDAINYIYASVPAFFA